MTQEDKKLLLQDLCARLPYGVKITWDGKYPLTVTPHIYCAISSEDSINNLPKLLLRPMSSMTEEEFEKLKEYSGLKYEQLDLASYQNGTYKCLDFYLSEVPSYVVILVFDWLNKNHFDYRGLIEKGLAIAVTEDNNPYKS